MKDYTPRTVDILSFLYTIGFFVTIYITFFVPFPPENKDALLLLLGVLTGIMAKIIEAYFSKDAINSATAVAIRSMNATTETPTLPKGDENK